MVLECYNSYTMRKDVDIDPVEMQKEPSVFSLTNCAMHFLVLFFIPHRRGDEVI